MDIWDGMRDDYIKVERGFIIGDGDLGLERGLGWSLWGLDWS